VAPEAPGYIAPIAPPPAAGTIPTGTNPVPAADPGIVPVTPFGFPTDTDPSAAPNAAPAPFGHPVDVSTRILPAAPVAVDSVSTSPKAFPQPQAASVEGNPDNAPVSSSHSLSSAASGAAPYVACLACLLAALIATAFGSPLLNVRFRYPLVSLKPVLPPI
jgi:hypothetical protein